MKGRFLSVLIIFATFTVVFATAFWVVEVSITSNTSNLKLIQRFMYAASSTPAGIPQMAASESLIAPAFAVSPVPLASAETLPNTTATTIPTSSYSQKLDDMKAAAIQLQMQIASSSDASSTDTTSTDLAQ